MQNALIQAGFHLVSDETEDGRPGLSAREVPAGVVVRWAASDGFNSLAHQRSGGGDSIQAIVQAAVSSLLGQLGHTVTGPSAGGELVILADQQR
ncbi:hypothetical protein [Streptomyces sp. NRRL B-24484]|uniref:hypothetical protein n=1 Tax=Streptomyces sp. NRRL B-24484 TaxID=1463833 RepID=UPI00133137F5|nr:hypothetical protein [Streptomyces sp. NRRL B-24484]